MNTIQRLTRALPGAAGLLLLCASAAGRTGTGAVEVELTWNSRAVEHLLNRAGFGARPEEIERWVEAGPKALVERLLDVESPEEPYFYDRLEVSRDALADMDREGRRRAMQRLKAADKRQLQGFLAWWVDELVNGEYPLRERMTLFWHGFFTSSVTDVKRSYPMIRQNELLREHALGSYADLLRKILRDPAMLRYLDNDSNKKASPNENLARELMELFSLGEGNFTEQDVHEAARALTGRTTSRFDYLYRARQHDPGKKTILGVTGRADGDDLVDILLAQDACPRWVAGRLLEYFEGVAPTEQRRADYAAFLRREHYEIRPFLRRLFLDPRFYRDEVVGARVLSPIDYLVGSCRRLGLDPPPAFLVAASGLLGQRLLAPPNVKGWEEGPAWITTSSLMQRGNVMGALLGVVVPRAERLDPFEQFAAMDAERPAMDSGADMAMDGEALMSAGDRVARPAAPYSPPKARPSQLDRLITLVDRANYRPRMNLIARITRRGLLVDRDIVDYLLDELLAIEPPAETRELLLEHLRRERRSYGIEGRLVNSGAVGERILRRLAHLILSLPEAQLG